MAKWPMMLTPAERRVLQLIRSHDARLLLREVVDMRIMELEHSKEAMLGDTSLDDVDFMEVFGQLAIDKGRLENLKEDLDNVHAGG